MSPSEPFCNEQELLGFAASFYPVVKVCSLTNFAYGMLTPWLCLLLNHVEAGLLLFPS
jgi:hypothetical protein